MAQYNAKVDPEIPGRSSYAQYNFEASSATDASKKLKRLFRAEFGKPLRRGMFKVVKKISVNPASPASPIPVGKWVTATKVKVNRDGTVNAMVPGSSLKRNPTKKKAKRKAVTKKATKKTAKKKRR